MTTRMWLRTMWGWGWARYWEVLGSERLKISAAAGTSQPRLLQRRGDASAQQKQKGGRVMMAELAADAWAVVGVHHATNAAHALLYTSKTKKCGVTTVVMKAQ